MPLFSFITHLTTGNDAVYIKKILSFFDIVDPVLGIVIPAIEHEASLWPKMTPDSSLDLITSQESDSPRPLSFTYGDDLGAANTDLSELRLSDGALLDLPPDILLLVFESLATFSDVQALVLTNRAFYNIWRIHCWTIYANLLPQLILCYPEAEQLAA